MSPVMYDYKSPLDTMYQPGPKPRTAKATALKVAAAAGILALAGIAGIAVASHCGYGLHHQDPVLAAPAQFRGEQLPAILLRRENSDEPVPGLQPYDYSVPVGVEMSGSVVSGGDAARATGDDSTTNNGTAVSTAVGAPVVAPTSLSTADTVSGLELNNTTQTSTTTLTTTVVIVPSATHTCTSSDETVVVTLTVLPEQQSRPPVYGTQPSDATITGTAATVTDVQADTHFTSGAPDATVSGTPATITDVQTDTHFTSGVPDATVSATPSTVTDVQTDTHFTSGAPDATVSGEPATVTSILTNTASGEQSMTTLTFTSINTVIVTVSTTVTRSRSSSVDVDSSVLGLSHTTTTTTTTSSSEAVTTTQTETVTITGGPPVTSTTTVELPQPYGDDYPSSYGTGLPINATASPTYIPPVVSAGTKGCGQSVAHLLIAAVAAAYLF